MLRHNRALLQPFRDAVPDPTRVHTHTRDNRPLGLRVIREPGYTWNRDDHQFQAPAFRMDTVINRHTQPLLGKKEPLRSKVRCPWCHTYFDFTYEEYRRDPLLQTKVKQHEESHTPPPGWEPDPRPMKGKGVTQYDTRHRFGWMLGEEW
ncbi:hypothetical protein DIPPA_27083 [Diplonema papillatum]|nr:hypothetical protein DIPPA_27083 [Diplonema papillatum]